MFAPGVQPRSRRPCSKGSRWLHAAIDAPHGLRTPIVGTFLACCASAVSGPVRSVSEPTTNARREIMWPETIAPCRRVGNQVQSRPEAAYPLVDAASQRGKFRDVSKGR